MRKYFLKTSAWMIVVASSTPGSGTAEMPRSQAMRAVADVGVTHFTSTVIAIRGQRLALGSYSVV